MVEIEDDDSEYYMIVGLNSNVFLFGDIIRYIRIYGLEFDGSENKLESAKTAILSILIQQSIFKLSIKIHALEMKHDDLGTSPPKQIHIYKINNLNVNFEDIKELTPDISIKCTTNFVYLSIQ